MKITDSVITVRDEFLSLVKEVKQTKIVERICSAEDARKIKKVWVEFIRENMELISRVRKWESYYIENQNKLRKIFRAKQKIEDAMEIAICIRLMNAGGMEIFIFEDENDLSDALSEIPSAVAKKIAWLSYEQTIKSIQAKEIFK